MREHRSCLCRVARERHLKEVVPCAKRRRGQSYMLLDSLMVARGRRDGCYLFTPLATSPELLVPTLFAPCVTVLLPPPPRIPEPLVLPSEPPLTSPEPLVLKLFAPCMASKKGCSRTRRTGGSGAVERLGPEVAAVAEKRVVELRLYGQRPSARGCGLRVMVGAAHIHLFWS